MGKVKVVHLFSGVGAPEMALKKLKIQTDFVGFSEIDKYAIQSYQAIHGKDIPNLGSITDIKELPYCDLLVYGSPCQDFSIAGLQKGMIDENGQQTRSGLLLEVERLLDVAKQNDKLPNILLMENVKNLVGKKFKPDFDKWLNKLEELGYNNYWQVLNAKDYGIPQNRERVFVVSVRKDADEGYNFPRKMPLTIRLKDVLEEFVDEKFYISDNKINKILNSNFTQEKTRIQQGDICQTLLARDFKDPKCVRVMQVGNIVNTGNWDNPQRGRIYSTYGISPTLNCMQGGGLEPKIIQKIDIPQTVRVRKYEVDIEKLKVLLKEHKKYTNKEIANKLNIPQTKVEHWFRNDNCFAIPDAEYWYKLKEVLDIRTNEFDKSITTFEEKECTFEKSNRCYFDIGISPTLTATSADEKIIVGSTQKHAAINKEGICPTLTSAMGTGGGHVPMHNYDLKIRKLTPKECWRLMGFSDEDFEKAKESGVSNSQLYKQAGNSIVVDVLYYIFKEIYQC